MENDITKRRFDYLSPYEPGPAEIALDVQTYSNNGTMAILMMRTQPMAEELEEMERMGMEPMEGGFREYYACATVNLEKSDTLPINVQFIDENNLPGIGAWLEENGIARPTELLSRSGWCLYPAYEFNIPQEDLMEVRKRRMEINPVQTVQVMAEYMEDTCLDLKDGLDRCTTAGELAKAWESMPEEIRARVTPPGRDGTDIDGCRNRMGRQLDGIMEEARKEAEDITRGHAQGRGAGI